nr:reverse transcriptase domain-containing protein [Tanacetum cinerariifolium]
MPVSDEDLREYCDKNYHQILPIIAEKLPQKKAQQEKLKAVEDRLNFEEASQYSESESPNRRRNLKERLGPRYARTRSESPKPRRCRSKSPRKKGPERITMFKRLEKGVFHRLGERRRMCMYIQEAQSGSHTTVVAGTHKAATKVLAIKKQKLLPRNIITKESIREERKQCQKTRMPSHLKTYDGSEDPEDHLKIFQAAAKTKRWAMPAWCHMFDSTLAEMPGKFHPEIKNQLIPANTLLVGFSGEIIWPLGQISLLVRIGDKEHSTSAWMNFMVVRSPSPYNEIIGRPGTTRYGVSKTIEYDVQELLKVTNNCKVKGLTTRGRKTTTQDTQNNDDGIHTEEPHTTNHDKPVESDEVLTNDQPQEASEPLAQP